MAIFKYLDVSTGHLTRETLDELELIEQNIEASLTVAPYTHGVFVGVPENDNEIDALFANDDLKLVLKYARQNDCDVVRFDADADFDDNLPVLSE